MTVSFLGIIFLDLQVLNAEEESKTPGDLVGTQATKGKSALISNSILQHQPRVATLHTGMPPSTHQLRSRFQESLGKYGAKSFEASKRKTDSAKQQYSLSLLAAVAQDRLISSQIIEGGVDAVLFENFIYHSLRSIRSDPELAAREVILLMDNAVIHKHQSVLETALKFRVNVLFNAEYSPWLNPIENLFNKVKRELRQLRGSLNTK